eukprot:GHVL01037198.1.p1 GENE.GHVL01037198.1~~GHVL01037198.1.p1  ORF type:complete len:295 (+),score=38.26 GHVL01037198.1:67-951(+)
MDDQDQYRVILIGNTGSGKSSTGNTLLDRSKFPTGDSFSASTTKCSVQTVSRDQYTLTVVDTPGLADSEDCLPQAKEVVRSLQCVKPGPHALLFTISLNTRFTEEDYNCYRVLKHLLGNEITSHLVLVFTHGDSLENEETAFLTLLETAPPQMVRILEECKHRYVIIDNTRKDAKQVGCLVRIIKQLKSQSDHFSSLLPGLPEEQLEKEIDSRIKQAQEQETRREKTVVELQKLTDEIEGTIKNLDELKYRQQRLIMELLEEENFETRRVEAVKIAKQNYSTFKDWNNHTPSIY